MSQKLGGRADWLTRLRDDLPGWLQALRIGDRPGRLRPCLQGAEAQGRGPEPDQGRGFGLKTAFTIGLWDQLPPGDREAWIDYIRSFQIRGRCANDPLTQDAFIDRPVIDFLRRGQGRKAMLRQWLFPPRTPQPLAFHQLTVLAETKQAIASLAAVGANSERPYRGFPRTPEAVGSHLRALDWTRPWGAGAHAAVMAVLLTVEGPRIMTPAELEACVAACAHFVGSVADQETGAWFVGPRPEYGELVNGAMKVLTGLDWLDIRPHRPERLVDLCLSRKPDPEGCHLVDAVYVLRQCRRRTDHRAAEVRTWALEVLDMLREHWVPGEGFSYFRGRAQTHYYGAPMTRGLAEADIHGTCLLVWAVSMALELLESDLLGWRVIKP